ncbi:hypothetical protein UKS_00940 [Streptococcus sp. 116-D4]|nr:hypothetical protein UKS_00940 [Streptococcus sp. 116-D4]
MYEKIINIDKNSYDYLKHIGTCNHVESLIQLLKYTIQCDVYKRKEHDYVIN